MAVKPIPDGYHTATPYLIVRGAARAIEFYKMAFGAAVLTYLADSHGKVGHAEIGIGDSRIMLADEFPDSVFRSPESLGGPGVTMLLYVDDVDTRFNQAITAGGQVIRPVQDQFYGDRSGTLKDPFGHIWTIATHKEDVSPAEIQRRFQDFLKQQSGA